MNEAILSWVALALGAVVVIRLFRGYRTPGMLRRAAEAVAGGAPLVDVRSPAEFREGHHPAAVNIPLNELSSGLHRLGSRSGPVVLYCRSGSRSAVAARTLKASGFTDVLDLGPVGNTAKLPVLPGPERDRRRIPSSRRRRRSRAA